MEYRILASDTYIDLEDTVNEKLKEGWKLQGGVSVSLSESDDFRYILLAQAIVKEESEE